MLPSLLFVLSLLPIALDRLSSLPTFLGLPPMAPRCWTVTTAHLRCLPAQGGVWRFRADSEPPLVTNLLIAVEDRRFWYHPGVDPLALVRASAQLVRSGRIVSGGSTIAMQAARLLHPRARAVGAKLIEMARAMQLEMRYGRRGVLDIWLTLAPFGGNLEGIRAGSLAWFGVPPEALEPAQAALLIAIPRRPERLRPDRHLAAAQAVRDRVLAVGYRAGLFALSDAPVPAARVPLPRHAPQFVASLPHEHLVRTTLDLPLQAALERLAQQRLELLPKRASLAILIADAASRDILALYPGDWRDQDRSGALDLTQAIRSPGSALKPFIYAIAFSDGIAAPDTILPDLPRRFGGYAPENFDRGFAGSITAGEALQRSLNLPAVALLDRVGPLRFAATLRAAGATLRLPRGADPSLPLALGGDGITLHQAAALYAALATDGTGGPLRLLTDARPAPRPGFLSAAAARQVADVLTRPLPDFGPRGIAWKTGHELGRTRRLGAGLRQAARRCGMDRTSGWHTVTWGHRHVSSAARAVPCVRFAAEIPALRSASPRTGEAGIHGERGRAAPVVPPRGGRPVRRRAGHHPRDGRAPAIDLHGRRGAASRRPHPAGCDLAASRARFLSSDRARRRRNCRARQRSGTRHSMIRALFALAFLFGIAGCAADDPYGPNTDGVCPLIRASTMPIETHRNMLFVHVTINGEPVKLLVDTGAEKTLLTEATIERLHLPRDYTHATRTYGIGNATAAWDALLPDGMMLGGVHFPVDRVTVGQFAIADVGGDTADGLLGADILLAFDLDLDLPKQQLTLYRARRQCPDATPPWSQPYIGLSGVATRRDRLMVPFELDGVPGLADRRYRSTAQLHQ